MFLISLYVLFNTISETTAQSAPNCYSPDRTLTEQDSPCHLSSEESACYNGNDVCLDNHLCLPQGSDVRNIIYRGTCTDPSWQSDACAKYCQDSELLSFHPVASSSRSRPADSYILILLLSATRGGGQFMFAVSQSTMCCGTGYPNRTCDQRSQGSRLAFEVPMGQIIYNRTSGSTERNETTSGPTSTIASTITVTPGASAQSVCSTASSIASSASACCFSTSNDAAIGAGVGVPLGVALIGALALLSRQRTHEQRLKKKVESWKAKYEVLARTKGADHTRSIHELGHTQAQSQAPFEMGEL